MERFNCCSPHNCRLICNELAIFVVCIWNILYMCLTGCQDLDHRRLWCGDDQGRAQEQPRKDRRVRNGQIYGRYQEREPLPNSSSVYILSVFMCGILFFARCGKLCLRPLGDKKVSAVVLPPLAPRSQTPDRFACSSAGHNLLSIWAVFIFFFIVHSRPARCTDCFYVFSMLLPCTAVPVLTRPITWSLPPFLLLCWNFRASRTCR